MRSARIVERAAPPPRVEQLIGSNRVGDWEAALALLPGMLRELVILRVEFGLDFAAIAAEMELSEPAARAETVNALAALIDALGEWRRGRAA
ncbi:MAG: sigma factor-like helix-turn-helix DNA-binding protein [Rhodanobacteraceae bacterium]